MSVPLFGVGTFRLTGQAVFDSALERNGREVSPEGLAPAWD